jgi:hypothetical protein
MREPGTDPGADDSNPLLVLLLLLKRGIAGRSCQAVEVRGTQITGESSFDYRRLTSKQDCATRILFALLLG